jgi:2-methylisocitrate lyase-like PEP mutase family enzyme
MPIAAARIAAFRDLHADGCFTIPNPFDAGSARLLAALGFPALATTSSGFAATLGRADMSVTRDELAAHVGELSAATELPLNADAERCYSEELSGIAETVSMIADAGAAGLSIEDWDPSARSIDPIGTATARVEAAAAAAAASGVVLTARCENHIRGVSDLDDTITRLCAYRDAGADVVYAPGLVDLGQIGRVVKEVARPVNVLLLGPLTVGALADVGVRRVSVGGSLAWVAYGALAAAATALRDTGALPKGSPSLDRGLAAEAFAARR